MAKTLGAFDYDIGISGAWVRAAREPLCPGCLSDAEVDANIRLLKDDLDAIAARMKRAICEQARQPLALNVQGGAHADRT